MSHLSLEPLVVLGQPDEQAPWTDDAVFYRVEEANGEVVITLTGQATPGALNWGVLFEG